jgi:hypothetical protein
MLQNPSRVMPGRAEIQGLQLLESCSFRWIFDATTHRFRRTPRDARVCLDAPEAWTGYHHLEIDAARSCFVVELDEGRSRLLRAWLHTDGCHRCRRDGRRAAVASFGGRPVRRAKR